MDNDITADASSGVHPLHHALATRLAVAIGVIAFAALLAHLSHVVLPIALFSGLLLLLHRTSEHTWQSCIWTHLQQTLKLSVLATPTSTRVSTSESVVCDPPSPQQCTTTLQPTALHGLAPISETDASVLPAAAPEQLLRTATPLRRRSKLAVPRTRTPSLRVTDLGVDANGAPLHLDTPRESLGPFVVEPNSDVPYTFENDVVKGELLFLLNRQDAAAVPDRVTDLFVGKRRLFWVQMQLQFKRPPAGQILYIGGEVPQAMHLGFFTGGLTRILLSVLQSLVRGLHYSFGKLLPSAATRAADEELPHICFPLYTAVDQFVCTPFGEVPPALGSLDFGEPKAAALARRKASDPHFAYNTRDTYSFHFHSYFINFTRWQLQNVPGMRDVDLRAFWADMPLQLVAYSIKPEDGRSSSNTTPQSDSDAKKAVHTRQSKEYAFCFELSHCVQPSLSTADDDVVANRVDRSSSHSSSSDDDFVQLAELQRALAKYDFSVPAWFEYFSSSAMHSERRVGYALLVHKRADDSPAVPATTNTYMALHTAVVAFAPLACLEHALVARKHKRSRSRSGTSLLAGKPLEASISVRARSHRYSKIEDERQFLEFELQQLAQIGIHYSDNDDHVVWPDQLIAAQTALLDLLQHKRTSLRGEWPFLTATSCCSNSSDGLASTSSTASASDVQALNPSSHTVAIKDAQHAAVQVVRVVTSTRWRHEWLTLDRTSRVLRFFRTMASSPSFAIELDQVLSVDAADYAGTTSSDSEATAEIYWIHVGLLEKCHHVAFGSLSERARWVTSIRETIHYSATSKTTSTLDARLAESIIESSARLTLESFVSDAPKARARFVLNDRCDFVLHTAAVPPSDPNAVVAQCLQQVLALQAQRLQSHSTRDLLTFLHAVSTLKWLDLRPLLRCEDDLEANKKALFLNLFHTLVVHASVLGLLPKSKLQWSKFFNGASYNVGGLYFSLAEIEHCVIRAPMTPLRLPIAFLVLPKLDATDDRAPLALSRADFRLNFALNCMTKSCTRAVVVYDPTHIDAQLDFAVCESVELLLTYDRESRVVYLPKVCDWYRGDFVAAAAAAFSDTNTLPTSVNAAMLQLLVMYLRGPKRELLEYALAHADALVSKYKFTKYDYRFQEALDEALAARIAASVAERLQVDQ